MRREKSEYIITTGKLEEKRGKGQPIEIILDSLVLHRGTFALEMR